MNVLAAQADAIPVYLRRDDTRGNEAIVQAAEAFEVAASQANVLTAAAWLEPLILRYRPIGKGVAATRVEAAIRARASARPVRWSALLGGTRLEPFILAFGLNVEKARQELPGACFVKVILVISGESHVVLRLGVARPYYTGVRRAEIGAEDCLATVV